MNLANISARRFASEQHTWSVRDTKFYTLNLDIGQDPLDAILLRFVQAGDPLVLPTQAAVLVASNAWMRDEANGINFKRLVTESHRIPVLHPLSTRGQCRSELQVSVRYAVVACTGESLRIDLRAPRGTQVRFRCVSVAGSAPMIEDDITWWLPEPFSFRNKEQ